LRQIETAYAITLMASRSLAYFYEFPRARELAILSFRSIASEGGFAVRT
jgi:hypothetical protein